MKQNEECDFMKKSQADELVQQQTKTIQGKVIEKTECNYFFQRLIMYMKFLYKIIHLLNGIRHNFICFHSFTKISSRTMLYKSRA